MKMGMREFVFISLATLLNFHVSLSPISLTFPETFTNFIRVADFQLKLKTNTKRHPIISLVCPENPPDSFQC